MQITDIKSNSYDDSELCIGDTQNSTHNTSRTKQTPENEINGYIGGTKDGKMHGRGVLKDENFTFIADFENDSICARTAFAFTDEEAHLGNIDSEEFCTDAAVHYLQKNNLEGSPLALDFIGQFSDNNFGAQAYYDDQTCDLYINVCSKSLSLVRYANDDIYMGKIKNDKPHGFGILTKADGSRQTGTFEDGELTEGSLFAANGDQYIGQIRALKPHKKATAYYANAEVYTGEFYDGQKQGEGTLIFGDNKAYRGWFRADKPSNGSYYDHCSQVDTLGLNYDRYCNQDQTLSYEGCHNAQGQPSGYGRHKIADVSTYCGQFTGGKATGFGVLTIVAPETKATRKYVGDFVDAKKHGYGVYTDNSGATYRGYFVEHRYEGVGEMRIDNVAGEPLCGIFKNGRVATPLVWYDNGLSINRKQLLDSPDYLNTITTNTSSYVGSVGSNNQKHGYGKLKTTDGKSYSGFFVNDKKEGEGIIQYKDKSWYVGQFESDEKNGLGFTQQSNGTIHIGQNAAGKINGVGASITSKGDVILGNFEDDSVNGFCLIFFESGAKYYGYIKNGKRHGYGVNIDKYGIKTEGVFEDGELKK